MTNYKKYNLYNLTPAQQNIDDLQKFYKGTSISTLCGAVIFEEKFNLNFLVEAVKILIRKHQIFHTEFLTENGQTFQYFNEDIKCQIDIKKFASVNDMRTYCKTQAHTPFDCNLQVFRITIFEIPGKTGIILCASHLIADAHTYSILAKDVYEIYKNLCKGEKNSGQIYKYSDYIEKCNEYRNSRTYEKDKEYWLNKYSKGFEKTYIKSYTAKSDNINSQRYTTCFSRDFSKATYEFCLNNKISPWVIFQTAVIIYLAKLNPENRTVTIGVPVLGRSGTKEKNTGGMFVSTLPLTLEFTKEDSAICLCRKTADIQREIFRHRKINFNEILRELREKNGFSAKPYNVMVSCQNSKTNIPAKTEWFSNGYCELPLAFHIDNRDSLDKFTVTVDYQTGIFRNQEEIKLIIQRIKHIISQIIADKEIKLNLISILPPDECDKILFDFNKTKADYPKEKCVHQAFSEIAEKNPDKVAIVFRNQKYTYGEIEKLSDSLAHFLQDNGIGTNDIVPIIAHRHPFIITAMLAVMKTGGAYMPVSPDFPAERIKFMVENVSAKFVLTYNYNCTFAKEIKLENFDYSYNCTKPFNRISSDSLCYVIFTSGSTGKPKATAVNHRNVMNYCSENKYNVMGKIIKKGEKSIVSVTDIVFDIFVTESILPLLNEIVIYLADDEQAVRQNELNRLISKNKIEIIQTTPTKMRSFLFDKNQREYLSSLKTIILGGEEFSVQLYKEIKKYTSAEIYNIYGPAETTVWSSSAKIFENNFTVGKPVANTHIYILDEKLKPLPVGVNGEIYISGDGVGKGYINNPELTREKFLPDPFFQGLTMYKTGDTGFFNADGNINFSGRKDFQIKLRGLRIEPGEIENTISSFESIRHTAVVCKKDEKGEKSLVAYYTSERETDLTQLKNHICRKLPAYMIPKYFVKLSEMPMTQSGKIDRKTLSELKTENAESLNSNFTPPENQKEIILCNIAKKVLKINRFGTEDDFFEYGGDSFSVLEFVTLAEKHRLFFSPQKIYECRTIKNLLSETSFTKNNKNMEENYEKYPLKRTDSDKKAFRIFAFLSEFFYHFKVKGLERLSEKEKYIFCSNHESDLDFMWILTALSKKINVNDTFSLIAEEHLKKKISRKIFRIAGGIPVDRKGDFAPSVRRAIRTLKKEKKYLLIHPEGTRTRTGKLGKFKKGAALISQKTGVKTVPVFIDGAREIFPVNAGFPGLFDIKNMKKYTLKINFGKPVNPVGKSNQQITNEIKHQILMMKGGAKMIIGVDADGVLTDMSGFTVKFGKKFFGHKPVNPCAITPSEIFGKQKHVSFSLD